MQISWIASEPAKSIAALTAEGADVQKQKGFEPITSIAVIAAGAILTKALIRLYKDARYKGVIIDITRKPVEVREMPQWPRQQALLITATGPQLIEIRDPATIDADLKELLKPLGVFQ